MSWAFANFATACKERGLSTQPVGLFGDVSTDCLRAIGCRRLKLPQRELEFGWTRCEQTGTNVRAVYRDDRFVQTKRRRGYERFIARIKNARRSAANDASGRTASHDDLVFTIGKVALFHVSRSNGTTQFHRADCISGGTVWFCSKRFCNFLLHGIAGVAVGRA